MPNLDRVIGDAFLGAPTGTVVEPEPEPAWVRAPRDPNADAVADGATVVCPRPGDKVHEARLVPGASITDLTLVSLLIQAGWNLRLFGPAGYGKTSLAEAGMVAARAAAAGTSLEDGRAGVTVVGGTTGVRDEAVVGRPTQNDAGRWAFQLAKFGRAVRDGLGLVVNEADLLGYVLKALNSPMEREPLSLDAYEPGEDDVPVHQSFRVILTDNNDPQFPLEVSVRSRLKLELSVCTPESLGAMAVAPTDVHPVGRTARTTRVREYQPVALPASLLSGKPLTANENAATLVELLAGLAQAGYDEIPRKLDARLTLLELDIDELREAGAGAEHWIPGRREIIAFTQAEQIIGTTLALRAFVTKCQLTGVDRVAKMLIDALWGTLPGAEEIDLSPLAL